MKRSRRMLATGLSVLASALVASAPALADGDSVFIFDAPAAEAPSKDQPATGNKDQPTEADRPETESTAEKKKASKGPRKGEA